MKSFTRFVAVLALTATLAAFPGVPAARAAGVTVEYSPLPSRTAAETAVAPSEGMSLKESLSGSTWKVENPSALYDDIDAADPDYAAIRYVTDAGIMGGTGARRFDPDGQVSYRTLSVVCLRAFLPDVRTRNAFEYMLSCGYMPTGIQSVNQYQTYATWEFALPVIARCAGILPVMMYDAGEPELAVVTYSDRSAHEYLTKAGGELSVWKTANVQATSRDVMTRRDLATVLYDIHVWQDADPDNVTKYGFGYVDVSATAKFEFLMPSAWSDVISAPFPVVKFFREAGFKILLDSEYIEQYSRDNGSKGVVGLFSTGKKTLYARSTYTVLHELGHFVDYVMVRNSSVYASQYAGEKAAANSLISSYSNASAKEFFAEVFDYYVRHRDDADALGKMQASMPDTYAVLGKLEAADWYLGGGSLDAPNARPADAASAVPSMPESSTGNTGNTGSGSTTNYGTLNDPPIRNSMTTYSPVGPVGAYPAYPGQYLG